MKLRSEPSFHDILVPTTFNQLDDENRQDNLSFCNITCSTVLDYREFYECTFTKVNFDNHARRSMYVDVIFENCDFSNCDFRESVFRRVIFRKCRMTGIDLSHSTFEDVSFMNVQGQYANFNTAKMKRCLLQDSILRESAFSMCTLKEMEIHDCDFTSAEFLDTRLKDLDFSDSNISGISFEAEHLKGIILNEEQAIACAKLLGIIVK